MSDIQHQLSLFDTQKKHAVVKNAWSLYIDGASRNNPGKSGIGIYILKNDEPIFKQGFYTGIKTNNEAEYLALIVGLFICKEHMEKESTLDIFSDSQLVVKQIDGVFRVLKPEIQKLHRIAIHLLEGVSFFIQYINRERNEQADLLANQGIDTCQQLPNHILHYARSQGIDL